MTQVCFVPPAISMIVNECHVCLQRGCTVAAGRPGTTPLEVVLCDGTAISVWPVLCGAEGDMPILALLESCLSHTSKHACFRCALNGVWCEDARTVRCACSYPDLTTSLWDAAAAVMRMAVESGAESLTVVCLLLALRQV